MKLFGIQFGNAPTVRTEPQAFSSPFQKIGKGDLTLPFITSAHQSKGVVFFGSDNLFPQTLNQMYYTSPIHGAIIDFTIKACIGGGFEVEGLETGKDKVDFEVFKSRHKIGKLLKQTTRDKKMHNRVHLLFKYSDSGKFLKMERIDPSAIRYRFDGNFEYSWDWKRSSDRRTIESFHPSKIGNFTEMMYTYGEVGAGQDIYPIPTYSSCLNWCYLDGEQSFLHKNNIQNSIFPSLVIRRPKRFGSKKEIEDFKDGLTSSQGAENSGRVMVLTGDGIENVPTAEAMTTNQNDNLFLNTSKEIKDNICFAHEINPSIMGVKVAGSLGNAQELEMSYKIFEKNVVLPMREDIQDMFDELLQILGIKGTFKINDFTLMGSDSETISSTGDKLNKMSPLLANKVLDNLTINEIRNIAGLPPVKDGDLLAPIIPPTTPPTV